MRIAIHALDSLFAKVTDADHDGFLSVSDQLTVELNSEEGRVHAQHDVYAESIASPDKLASYLTALSGRQVNVLSAPDGSAYLAYSTPDRSALAGVADGVTGRTYDIARMDAHYEAPDYAQGYPASARKAVLESCRTRPPLKYRSDCAARVEANYKELLQLAQDYAVNRTRLRDEETALNQLFLSGSLSVESLKTFVGMANAVESAWGDYATYDL